jgi:beta-N-acetylhexosaminidase
MKLPKSIKLLFILSFGFILFTKMAAQPSDPLFSKYINHPWVDSVMNTLSTEQKIAQCIWVAGYSDREISHEVEISDIIRKYGVGGIVFFQGTAEKQAELTNYYQKISKVPLLISLDAELGVGMRLRNVEKFPYPMTLSAIKNDSLIYQFGKAVALQFNRLGMHINLAHLNLPSQDTTTGLPSSLSQDIIKGLRINDLGSRGHIITDTFNMKGVTRYFNPGEADAEVVEKWNDVIEFVTDVEAAIRETKSYIFSKRVTNEDITLKCRKVLALKFWSGLNQLQPINKENIDEELSPMTSKALIRDLYANALTVLNNNENIIPVKNLQNIKIATVAINKARISSYQLRIAKYQPSDHFFLDPLNPEDCTDLLKKLSNYDIVIAGIFGLDQRPNTGFGIEPGMNDFIKKLVENNRTIVTWFGNPYGIDKIKSLQNADGLILTYQENEYTEDLAAQLMFGGIGAKGSLPVTINEKWPCDFGIITQGNLRLQYGFPESADMSSEILNRKIDSIVNVGLTAKAFPGCEVMAARKGIVVFQKTYGYQTYDNRVSVLENDLFDLASVTKIVAALPGLMLLNTEGKFSPDETLGSYLTYYRKSNKSDLLLRDMLTHQAGLTTWIPFWKETVKKDGKFKRNIFNYEYADKFPVEVASGLYINKNYKKKIFKEIKRSPVGEKKYLYSDLTFIIAPEIIEKLSGQNWSDFVSKRIYQKIGAFDIGFNPYLKYPLCRIVPTEYDSLFRKQLLHGTVHDEGAAMLGGISGHAGLFATANDLMKLMELYRRMGEYGGEQIIGKDVMEKYTSVQFPDNNNPRGLGFDKPLLNNSELTQKEAYPTRSASPSSFGHSGYTGTFVWIDPDYEVIYIFLSNRVYPTRNNNLLSDLKIRKEILQAIYDSIRE